MSDTTPPKESILSPINVVMTLTGGAIVAGYYLWFHSLEKLSLGDWTFTYFPFPRFTWGLETLFLVLVILVGMWHIGLAIKPNSKDAAPRKQSTFWQVTLGMMILLLPLIFRLASQFVSQSSVG